MIETKIQCDICGVERKEVNHWHLARLTSSGLHFPKTRKIGDKDLCGQVCAHKLLDRYLSTGSIEAPNVPPNQ